jgi:hypothetical protein
MVLRRSIAGLATVLAVFALVAPHTTAQQESVGGSGLSISPTRSELTINPGHADNIQITLKNTSGVDITARAEVNDFEADGTTGEPKILTNTKTSTPYSIKKFLVGVADIPLKKDESKKFDIPVQIPANAVSGGYFGVIRYTAEAQNKEEAAGRQVALNASVGLIVLIQVPGNITEQVQAQKITVSRNSSNGGIFIAAPQKANITLKNTGNGFSKPFGHVTITKGGKEVYSYEMNNTDPRSNILPNNTRTFTDDIKNVSKMGRYTITANISYGTGGDILTLKTSFWVLPLWLVLVLIGTVLILLVAGFILYRRISKKRRRR